jgi:DNA-binding transcriptional LysR family regulator
LAVPTMAAKIAAQRAGLAVGWLPRHRVSALISGGELVEKKTADQREPNTLYVAWRSEHTGKALDWWLERLREPRLMKRLVQGLEVK